LKEIKNTIALLEWVANPSSKYGLIKAAKDFKLGMGEKTVDSVYKEAGDNPNAQQLITAMSSVFSGKFPDRAKGLAKMLGFADMYNKTDPADKWLRSLEKEFGLVFKLKAQDIKEHKAGKHKDRSREESIKSLMLSLQGTTETVGELIDRARLAEAMSKSDDGNSITLSTIHKSKG